MKKPNPSLFGASPAVLTAFVRAVATAGDSPTVIRRVAADTAYVDLCRRIAALETGAEPPPLLVEACRRNAIPLPRLRARLIPVAQALRLAPAAAAADHYRLLGVAPDSGPEAIRAAYRRRARELHPDLRPRQAADTEAFSALTAAYDTLRDPVAREAYDQARRGPDTAWFEPPPRRRPANPRRLRFTAVIVAVVLLAAAALVFDQLDRETTRRQAIQAARGRTARAVDVPDRGPANLADAAPPGAVPAPSAAPEEAALEGALPSGAPVGFPAATAEAPQTPAAPVNATAARQQAAPAPAAAAAPADPVPSAAMPDAAAPPAPADAGRPAPEDPAVRRLALFYPEAEIALARALQTHLTAERYPPPHMAASPEARDRPSNIRYFSAVDREAARSLRTTVQAFLTRTAKRPDPPVRLLNLARRYPDAAPGLLEVWINTAATPAQPAAQAAAPPPRPAPAGEVPTGGEATEDGVQAFLDTYCRIYESRDADRLAALFEPQATENGAPFAELLPRYRANLARMTRLSYRIAPQRLQAREGAQGLRVEGRFTAHGEFGDRRRYESRGTIALELAPHGEGYRIARLDYEVE